ncbi:MAG: hypothetical protein ABIB79_02225 [archaeon]
MIKRMSKRGEGGPGLGTFITLLVALVIGGLIIYFVYGISETANAGVKTFTAAHIDGKVLACKLYANDIGLATFCRYTELEDEKNTYLNCQQKEVIQRLNQQNIDTSELACSETPEQFCKKMRTEEGTKFNDQITVNGLTCKDWGVTKDKDVLPNTGEDGTVNPFSKLI